MNEFLIKLENALSPYAKQFTPEGTEVKAVVHQWGHAIAYDNDIFASSKGANKGEILKLLKETKCYQSSKQFKKELRDSINLNPDEKPKFTFIDLFAGIGGMRQGFELAGGACVFSSEFENKAQETYHENYGEYPFGDITKIANEELVDANWVDAIPSHDILIGGFPCQPFSHAGLKMGIEDTRGTLFDNIAQILNSKKPKFALLENVRGLISHDKGHTLKIVLRKLIHMGYRCSIPEEIIFSEDAKILKEAAKSMVLRSRDFGVPQNRQRIYIVLWRKDLDINFKYPAPTGKATKVSDILEKTPKSKYTISDKLWAGHQRRKINNKKNGKGFGYGLVSPESEYTNTISARYYKDGSECLIDQGEGRNPRKITPKEASRLQGFPDGFILNKSDVQAYKQFGNSVSIPVIEALAIKILEADKGEVKCL